MKKMLAQLAADISREVNKTLKPLSGRIHTVLVAGKVGEMVYEYLNLDYKLLIDDPQFGNATVSALRRPPGE
jgi:plasmid segregation protein ParM